MSRPNLIYLVHVVRQPHRGRLRHVGSFRVLAFAKPALFACVTCFATFFLAVAFGTKAVAQEKIRTFPNGSLASPGSMAFESSVLKVMLAKRPVDIDKPWQYERVKQVQHLGIYMGQNRILTTAYAVKDASLIEVQKFDTAEKHPAKIVFVDYEINLALIAPENPAALQGLRPAKVARGELAIGSDVQLHKVRDSYQLTTMPGRLWEVGVFSATTSSYSAVSYLLKVQQSGLGWSEPVTKNGEIVALTSGQDNNFVHAIPAPILRHFLEDSHNEKTYRGFPAIGVKLAPLVSPDMRQMIGAASVEGGTRVARVFPGSFEDVLAVDDVILAVEGHELNVHGYFAHPAWGKLHLKYLLNKKYSGDDLSLVVLRKGERLELKGTLQRYDSNRSRITEFATGSNEPFLIFGGLVFQELSKAYFEQWGDDWRDLAPYDLLYINEYENELEKDDRRRYLVLGRVLADEFNRGYEKMRHQVIASVNGVAVENLRELRQALQEKPIAHQSRLFARFVFERDGGEVILAYDELDDAHTRVARTYGIDASGSRHFFQPQF